MTLLSNEAWETYRELQFDSWKNKQQVQETSNKSLDNLKNWINQNSNEFPAQIAKQISNKDLSEALNILAHNVDWKNVNDPKSFILKVSYEIQTS